MSGMGDEEEEYRGPVTLVVGEVEIPAEAHLAGHFDPLTGDYRWVGRLAANESVTASFDAGETSVLVRTPEGHEGRGTLGDPNVWGGHRITGSGPPPFEVPVVDPTE